MSRTARPTHHLRHQFVACVASSAPPTHQTPPSIRRLRGELGHTNVGETKVTMYLRRVLLETGGDGYSEQTPEEEPPQEEQSSSSGLLFIFLLMGMAAYYSKRYQDRIREQEEEEQVRRRLFDQRCVSEVASGGHCVGVI